MHFLPSAEVFSIFPIVTPVGSSLSKKGVKVSCLYLLPKDFLIFYVLLFIPYLLGFVKHLGIFFGFNYLKSSAEIVAVDASATLFSLAACGEGHSPSMPVV